MFLSAPVSACSWQTEGYRLGTAGLSWGSRCSPCSAGLHQCGEPGSTWGWAALEGRGPSGASRCRHHCLSLYTPLLKLDSGQVKDINMYAYICYTADVSTYWRIVEEHQDLTVIAISLNSCIMWLWLLSKVVKRAELEKTRQSLVSLLFLLKSGGCSLCQNTNCVTSSSDWFILSLQNWLGYVTGWMKVEWKQQHNTHKTSCASLIRTQQQKV